LGFQFERDPASSLIAHPSALYFISEGGVISQVLPGTSFKKEAMLSALWGASHGRIEKLFARLDVFCGSLIGQSGTQYLSALLHKLISL
jgi:hypothetical protein